MITTTTAVVPYDPERADPEKLALSGFLGGYRGLTRPAYDLDLRQFLFFCGRRQLGLFAVRRADIEAYGRELEAAGKARATVATRLCTRRRLLSLRRGGGPHRPLAGGSRAARAPRL